MKIHTAEVANNIGKQDVVTQLVSVFQSFHLSTS